MHEGRRSAVRAAEGRDASTGDEKLPLLHSLRHDDLGRPSPAAALRPHSPFKRGRPMSRRPILFALTLVALAATGTACADTTAPQPAAASMRRIEPLDQVAKDVVDPDVCRGGYLTGMGRAC